jgi:hypothetical protein
MRAFFGSIRVASVRFGSVRCRMGSARRDLAIIGHVGQKKETKSDHKGTKKRSEIENAAKTRKRVNFRPESKKFIIIV